MRNPGRWRAPEQVQRAAKAHRRAPTPAEAALWAAIRNEQLGGLRFRRQFAMGPFILDFYCPSRKLCIEVDGEVHDGRETMDAARTDALATRGIRVIRFRNQEVLHDLPRVLHEVLRAAEPAPHA